MSVRKSIFSFILALAATLVVAMPAAQADFDSSNLEVTKFDVTRDTTQAGGHPTTKILFQFCDQGVPIVSASNTSPIRITVSDPVTLQGNGNGLVRGAQGNTAAN